MPEYTQGRYNLKLLKEAQNKPEKEEETYRYSDPLYVSKIPTKSISILSFIHIINFLVQDPKFPTSHYKSDIDLVSKSPAKDK